MPEREQKKKPAPKERERRPPRSTPPSQGDAIEEELDDLLDEIDSVLETNAEEFVRSYVQKGGE